MKACSPQGLSDFKSLWRNFLRLNQQNQGKITKARSPQGLTRDNFCPWLLFASYVLTLP